jgi:hypothetical protein
MHAPRSHIADGLALYRREIHATQAFQYGSHDPGVCAYFCDAVIGTVMGFPDQSVGQMQRALTLAHELDHGPTLAVVLAFAAELHQLGANRRRLSNTSACFYLGSKSTVLLLDWLMQ